MSTIILHALLVTCASISSLPHAPMHRTISDITVQLHINHANNISHSSMLWQNYFITFETLSTYFLFKSLYNRNKTFMKKCSKIFTVFKHGWWCKLGYLFLVSRNWSLFTLVHQHFLLLFLIHIRTENHFDISPTVLRNSIISPILFKFSLINIFCLNWFDETPRKIITLSLFFIDSKLRWK